MEKKSGNTMLAVLLSLPIILVIYYTNTDTIIYYNNIKIILY